MAVTASISTSVNPLFRFFPALNFIAILLTYDNAGLAHQKTRGVNVYLFPILLSYADPSIFAILFLHQSGRRGTGGFLHPADIACASPGPAALHFYRANNTMGKRKSQPVALPKYSMGKLLFVTLITKEGGTIMIDCSEKLRQL